MEKRMTMREEAPYQKGRLEGCDRLESGADRKARKMQWSRGWCKGGGGEDVSLTLCKRGRFLGQFMSGLAI